MKTRPSVVLNRINSLLFLTMDLGQPSILVTSLLTEWPVVSGFDSYQEKGFSLLHSIQIFQYVPMSLSGPGLRN